MRVWDVELTVEPRQMIMMPDGAELLKIIVKGDIPYLYFQVGEEGERASNKPMPRYFITIGAGQKYDYAKYVDSFVINDWFIGHVFEADVSAWHTYDPRYEDDFKEINQERKLKEKTNAVR